MCSCYVALWLIGRVTEILMNVTLIVIVEVKLTVLLIVAVILTVIGSEQYQQCFIVAALTPLKPRISLSSPPPPSLSVCLHLFRALDDSVLAKLQPVEQMEKMQKVLEAFQAQVQGLLLL
jgi:hypothetical protein